MAPWWCSWTTGKLIIRDITSSPHSTSAFFSASSNSRCVSPYIQRTLLAYKLQFLHCTVATGEQLTLSAWDNSAQAPTWWKRAQKKAAGRKRRRNGRGKGGLGSRGKIIVWLKWVRHVGKCPTCLLGGRLVIVWMYSKWRTALTELGSLIEFVFVSEPPLKKKSSHSQKIASSHQCNLDLPEILKRQFPASHLLSTSGHRRKWGNAK